jgi:hypothetical protein
MYDFFRPSKTSPRRKISPRLRSDRAVAFAVCWVWNMGAAKRLRSFDGLAPPLTDDAKKVNPFETIAEKQQAAIQRKD